MVVFFTLAAVLVVLIPVLAVVLILILVLILVAVLVLILVIHFSSSSISLRTCRIISIPKFSGFILRFEQDACQQACGDGRSNTTGSGLQTAGEDAEKSVFRYRLLHTFRQRETEAG